MGKLFEFRPKLHFPVGTPFEVTDEFNGHQRGTWYYRSPFNGQLRGPFHHFEQASLYLSREENGAA